MDGFFADLTAERGLAPVVGAGRDLTNLADYTPPAVGERFDPRYGGRR